MAAYNKQGKELSVRVGFFFLIFSICSFLKEPDKKYNSEGCVVYPRLQKMGCCSIFFTKLMLF